MKILNYVLVAHAPDYYYYSYNNSESSHWRAIFRTHTHTYSVPSLDGADDDEVNEEEEEERDTPNRTHMMRN